MKKLLVILSMVFISSGLIAQYSGGDYVKTQDDTYFFKKIKSNADNLTGIKSDGKKVEFKLQDVISYVQKGKYYQRMPVYHNDAPTGETALMRVVDTKRGMALVEYKNKAKGQKDTQYFVFKGDHFVIEMDDKNEITLTSYFQLY
jgi:hypothetical protein